MDLQSKTPRKRVANFTADEKALLAQIIKKTPIVIVESKLTDGKSVAKKQAAWDLITQEFNSNANVHKRETLSLKRAWDNMKAFTRKARAEQRGSLLRTGGGPHAPPPPPQHGGVISKVEEAAPVIIGEVKNPFDSDGAILNEIVQKQEVDLKSNQQTSLSIDAIDILDSYQVLDSKENTTEMQEIYETDSPIKDAQKGTDYTGKNNSAMTTEQVRRPMDYIHCEAVIRIRHLENKKKIEMQILKTQLEVEQIKKKAALLEEQRNEILLEKAKIELEAVKKSLMKK